MTEERNCSLRLLFIQFPFSQQKVLLKDKYNGNKTHRDHSLYDYIVQKLPGQPALLSDLWEAPLAPFL